MKRNKDTFKATKHLLFVGCFLFYTILELISKTQCFSELDRNSTVETGKTKLHSTQEAELDTRFSGSRESYPGPKSITSFDSLLYSINSKVDKLNNNLEKYIRAFTKSQSKRNFSEIMNNSSVPVDYVLNNNSISISMENSQDDKFSDKVMTEIELSPSENFDESLENSNGNEKISFSQVNSSNSDSSKTSNMNLYKETSFFTELSTKPNSVSNNTKEISTTIVNLLETSELKAAEVPIRNQVDLEQVTKYPFSHRERNLNEVNTTSNKMNPLNLVESSDLAYSVPSKKHFDTNLTVTNKVRKPELMSRAAIIENSKLNHVTNTSQTSVGNISPNKYQISTTESTKTTDLNSSSAFANTEQIISMNIKKHNFSMTDASDNVDTDTEKVFDFSTTPRNDDSNDYEAPIPNTMAEVPGLDGKDSDNIDDIRLVEQTTILNDQDATVQGTVKMIVTEPNKYLPITEDPLELLNKTSREQLSSTLKYQQNESSQISIPYKEVGKIVSNFESFTRDTKRSASDAKELDSKPYTWKRICLQGVDKIHFFLDEHVIRLPENKADLYLFYYIPESMHLNRSGNSLYLPNEHHKHYTGGYLKHRYTDDKATGRSNDYTAYSLHQHKLINSLAKSNTKQHMNSDLKPATKIIHPKSSESSIATSVDPKIIAINKKTTNKSPHCFWLPFFPGNQTFGNFVISHAIPSSTKRPDYKNTVQVTSEDPRIQNFENGDRSKRRAIITPLIIDSTVHNNCSGDVKRCSDRSQCIPKKKWCNKIVDCSDKSDETNCSCRELMAEEKVCDNYFDCPNGEDEKGCFGCPEDSFSCDLIPQSSRATCIHVNQRCDGQNDCFDGTDEMDCELLTDTIDSHETFQTLYTSGYLHRNWQGKWYPACIEVHSEHAWGVQACRSELGVNVKHVEAELLPFHGTYVGKFISHLENGDITFVDTCKYPSYAVHVKCPSIPCGNRIPQKYFTPRYQSKREMHKDDKEEMVLKAFEIIFGKNNNDSLRGTRQDRSSGKVVGGENSKPGYWPWLVTLYKNGELLCGGTIIDETWILTAGHCVHEYFNNYYEIYAGILRRFSFSPSEQIRMVTHVIIHPEYSDDMKNDLALLKLNEPLKFNRWVRPICLPVDRPPWGPIPGTYCTSVGWGSTQEKGSHPDNMREVVMPVKSRCKEQSDQEGEEICAGYEMGGRDTCQGDSGGPFLCSLPRAHDQWYIAGVVSHGQGCARPHMPGAYTRVALFMPWIITHTDDKFLTPFRQSSHECPGIKCLHGGRCIGEKRICDTIVDCLTAEDETDCALSVLQSEDVENIYYGPVRSLPELKTLETLKNASIELSTRVNISSNNSSYSPNIKLLQSMSQIKETPSGARSVSSSENGSILVKSEELMIEKRETFLYFTCKHLPQNIPLTSYCDLSIDCEDGTDENNCTCADYLKVTNESLICDGSIHCYDLSDEQYCPDYTCTNDEFFCFKSRICIRKELVCDSKKDCSHGEDESVCYWPISIASNAAARNQFDMFGMPLFSEKGILAEYYGGVWKWACFPEENEVDVPKTVQKLAKRLGFKNYKSYTHLMVFNNEVLNGNGENYCHGLSVDFGVAHVRDESHIPWRVNIFVNGILKCLGVLIEEEWVLIDQSCCLHLNTSTDYIVAVLGNDGKLSYNIRTYEEQMILVDKIRCDQEALMHLTERPRTTKMTKSLRIPSRSQSFKLYKHFLLILEDTQSHIFELNLISNCQLAPSCYKIKNEIDFCLNSNSSRQFLGVINLSKKNEWIFSGGIVESLACFNNGTVVTINWQLSLSRQENNFVNIRQFSYRGHDGYRCKLGNQISWDEVCDGKTDCRENEDEIDISCIEKNILTLGKFIERSCKIDEFKCRNGRCVSKSAICNSINDCGDNTDEPDACSNFTCATYLNLTNPHKVCDSHQDCLDKSDENVKTCSPLCDVPSSFRCNKSNSCIPVDFVCDGERDCEFGEDEQECISYKVSVHNRTEGTIWMRSNGKWKQECFSANEMVAFDAQNLCKQFGYMQAINVKSTPAKIHIYTPFVQVKLNNFVEVTLKRRAEKELVSTEYCQYLHLSCT